MNIKNAPKGSDSSIVYVQETGRFYIRVDIGDVSYLFETPEGTTIYDLVDDPNGELGRIQLDDEANGILAAQSLGLSLIHI